MNEIMTDENLIYRLYCSIYFAKPRVKLQILKDITADIYQWFKYLRLQAKQDNFNQYRADTYYQLVFTCLTTFFKEDTDIAKHGLYYAVMFYQEYINFCDKNHIKPRRVSLEDDSNKRLKQICTQYKGYNATAGIKQLKDLVELEIKYVDLILGNNKQPEASEEKITASLTAAYYNLAVPSAYTEYLRLSWGLFEKRIKYNASILPKLNIALTEQSDYLLVEDILRESRYEFNKDFGTKRSSFNTDLPQILSVDAPSETVSQAIEETKKILETVFFTNNIKNNLLQRLGLEHKLKSIIADNLFNLRFDFAAYLKQLKVNLEPILKPSINDMLFDWDMRMAGIDYPYQEACGHSALIADEKLFNEICEESKGLNSLTLINRYIIGFEKHLKDKEVFRHLWFAIRLRYVPIVQQRVDVNDSINALNIFFHAIENMLQYHALKIIQASAMYIIANSPKEATEELTGTICDIYQRFNNAICHMQTMHAEQIWLIHCITMNTTCVLYNSNRWYFVLSNDEYIKYQLTSNETDSFGLEKIDQSDDINKTSEFTYYNDTYYFIKDKKVYKTIKVPLREGWDSVCEDIRRSNAMVIGSARIHESIYVFNDQNNCAVYQYKDKNTHKKLNTYSTQATKFLNEINDPQDLSGLKSVCGAKNKLYCFFNDATYIRFDLDAKKSPAKYSLLTFFLNHLKEFVNSTGENISLNVSTDDMQEDKQYISRIIRDKFKDVKPSKINANEPQSKQSLDTKKPEDIDKANQNESIITSPKISVSLVNKETYEKDIRKSNLPSNEVIKNPVIDHKQIIENPQSTQAILASGRESVHQTVLNPRLEALGLNLIAIPKNGHCLYGAVGLYLGETPDFLRRIVAARLEYNLEEFAPLITLSRGQCLEDYLTAVRQGNEWASHTEIKVLMHVLDRPILVIRPDNWLVNPDDRQRFRGEPIFVYYNGHNHYDGMVLQEGRNAQFVLDQLENAAAIKDDIIINPNYWYDDNDIKEILDISIHKKNLNNVSISPALDSSSGYGLKQYLEAERNDDSYHQKHSRQLLIAYNWGNRHWVAVHLEINGQEVKCRYLDPLDKHISHVLDKAKPVPDAIKNAVTLVYPQALIERVVGFNQNDSSSCGVLTIENLITLAKSAKLPDKDTSSEQIENFRREHIRLMQEAGYEYFANKQFNNVSTVASAQAQAHYINLSCQTKLNDDEPQQVNTLSELIAALSAKQQKHILDILKEPIGDDKDAHKRYLAKIKNYVIKLAEQEKDSTPSIPHAGKRLLEFLFTQPSNNEWEQAICKISVEVLQAISNQPQAQQPMQASNPNTFFNNNSANAGGIPFGLKDPLSSSKILEQGHTLNDSFNKK